jgi:lantibiotic modifying enzyme
MKPAYLETAERIGGRLCRDALWSEGRCNWTADRLEGTDTAHGSLGPSLYSGTAGIALFLWRLGAATGERIFRVTAEAALRQALSKPITSNPGFYTGAPGVLFAASMLGREIADDQAVGAARPDPRMLDLLSGSAGAIAALLHFVSLGSGIRLLETAVQHGDLLLAEASRGESGWSWTSLRGTRNLTGFSHGTAGIAWALLELWQVTREERFREAALEAFRYERACFDPERQAWPDFREDPAHYPALWCHGAVGIGFSRLRAWQILGDADCLAEVRVALARATDPAFATANDSLCHGRSGTGDFLLYASEVLGEERWLAPAEASAREGIELFERRRVPWPCGLPRTHETPDLMLGLAGIGYHYLRLADPQRTPTLLLPAVGRGALIV